LAELKHSQGFLEEAVAKGRISIERILPWESKTAGLERRYDAALLFLCYPMGIVSDQMETQILEDVQKNLCGTIGISRYLGDTFWGPNYKKIVGDKERTSPIEEVSARRLVDSTGLEAQWCIFDSIISVIYGRRYLRHARPGDRDRQIHFFNRALGQITAEKEVCPWKCPELYYWEDGSFVPGDVVPLYWAQSNLKLAFHYMRKSVG
jgi:phosphorylase kinase alpha/beta subunit